MKTLTKTLLSSALLAGLSLIASPARAGTATSNMAVSMTVAANCTISAGALSFGGYDPITANASTNLNGTAGLSVSCTGGAAGVITLGQGSNGATSSSDSAPLRQASNGAGTPSFLSYALYQDTGRTTVWGNTAGTGASYTGTGSQTLVTVYASVAAGQNVPAGSYSDTVVATVTF